MNILPALVGLGLALGGPPLVAVLGDKVFRAPGRLSTQVLGQAALVGLGSSVLLIVLGWEREHLSSLGLQPLCWQSLAWGSALAGFFIFIFSPLAMRLLARVKLGGFEAGLAKLTALPIWYRVFAVVVGGVIEETLYRGYAVPRLFSLTGSLWLAGLISVIAFGLAHAPMWGWGPALTTFAAGAVATLFYVWRQDLAANIFAHIVTDLAGIVFVPWLARARRRGLGVGA